MDTKAQDLTILFNYLTILLPPANEVTHFAQVRQAGDTVVSILPAPSADDG